MEYVYAGRLIKTIYLIFNHLIYWACFSLEWKECQTLFIALIWYKLYQQLLANLKIIRVFFAKNCVFLVYSAAIFLNINPSFWMPWGPKYTYNPLIQLGPIQIETSLHFVWILVSVQAGPTRTDSKESFSHKVLGTRQEIFSQRSFSSDLTFKLFL